MSKWRDISSAPKDGTVILAAWDDWDGKSGDIPPVVVSWDEKYKKWVGLDDYEFRTFENLDLWIPIPWADEQAVQ